jgi:hypothetical protein
MAEGVQAVVLCEDLQAQVFVRRVLLALGYDGHRIRVVPYPADGRGSGEQHVRERYPSELAQHRRRAARTRAVLAVHTDADRFTVAARFAALADELREKGVPQRAAEEPVAILVPKWNIETWIHFFLDGPPVDEDKSDYAKYTGHEADAAPSAEQFAAHARARTVPHQAPPSLEIGLEEARRVVLEG